MREKITHLQEKFSEGNLVNLQTGNFLQQVNTIFLNNRAKIISQIVTQNWMT